MKEQSKRTYLFGVFRLDASERVLYGEKGAVALTPKAFDTLLALVENSGRLLSKEELIERVWPDSFVEENNLVQNISTVRRVLSEQSGGGKFIETVPRRGYRFVAQVLESSAEAERKAEKGRGNKRLAGSNERRHGKGRPFLRDVVFIGRAIDFK